MNDLVCVADLGSTSIKVALVNEVGEIVANEKAASVSNRNGGVNFDADETFEILIKLLKDLIDKNQDLKNRILGLSLSSQRATVVPVGGDDRPSSLAYSWQDVSGEETFQKHLSDFGFDNYYDLTGLPCSGLLSASKILWCRENQPEVYRKTERFVLLHDYIMRRLGAKSFYTDPSNGSCTGLFSYKSRSWSDEILRILEIPSSLLPEIKPTSSRCGEVSSEVSALTGLKEGTPLFIGGGDQQCAAFGSGAIEDGAVSLTLGTAAVVTCPVGDSLEKPPKGLFLTSHISDDLWLLEGFHNSFAASIKWVRELLNIDPDKDLIELAKDGARDLNSPIFLPFLAGIGSPDFDGSVGGSFHDLKHNHGVSDISFACLRGISLEMSRILNEMESIEPLKKITVNGGLASNSSFLQILSDHINRPVTPLKVEEASLIGASLIAWTGVGKFSNIKNSVDSFKKDEKKMISPSIPQEDYKLLYDRYESLVEMVKNFSRKAL